MRMVRLIPVDSDSLRHMTDQLPADFVLDQWYSVKGLRGSDWEIKLVCPAGISRLLARYRTAFVTMTGRTIYAGYRTFSINLQQLTCREVYGKA